MISLIILVVLAAIFAALVTFTGVWGSGAILAKFILGILVAAIVVLLFLLVTGQAVLF